MECVAGLVVVAAARGFGEGVVGVVYLLELLGAGLALGAIGWDAIGVVAEGLSVKRRQYVKSRAFVLLGLVGRTSCMHRGLAVALLWSRSRESRL